MFKFFYRFILLPLVILVTSQCFYVSDQAQLLSNSRKTSTSKQCTEAEVTKLADTEQALNKKGFTLVSWNIYKGNKQGWMQDLLLLSDQSDLILLQEAYLTQELNQFLKTTDLNWDMISAFRYQGIHAGVMTMGHTPSKTRCAQRYKEPLLRLPKSTLISYYPIDNTQQYLLVANMHAINFTLGTTCYSDQLMEIKEILAQHKGPIVFAGDFNTWSDQREAVLKKITGEESLGLLKVEFISTSATRFWRHRIDHIFYRDLKVVNAEIMPVESSDHNPLKVKFEFLSKPKLNLY